MTRLRVIVVDDNRDAADTCAVLLSAVGAEVRTAYRGDVGLQLFDEFEPHVAFLDIGMPGIDGRELARELHARNPGTLLIAVSGWGRAEDIQANLEAGFAEHLTKPASYHQVLRIVAEIERRLPQVDKSPQAC